MKILGISGYYHDSAACIMVDGKILAAAQEERFTRLKHDNRFPVQAIEFCLQSAGLAANEVDVVAFYEKPLLKFERIFLQHVQYFPLSFKAFLNSFSPWFRERMNIAKTLRQQLQYLGKVVYVPHHLAHAASAYYISEFTDASVVTIDGVGEWATTTVSRAKNNQIVMEKEIQFPNSLGLLYSALTTYLGFAANDAEYKVMGLAAYGDPQPFKSKFDELVRVLSDGSYSLNMKYFAYGFTDCMFTPELIRLFGFPPRQPEGDAGKEYKDIAAALQAKLEEVSLNLLHKVYAQHRSPNLCFAGGVALNSVLNGKILSQTKFKNLFIPPDPGDGGGSMGAALWVNANLQLSGKKLVRNKLAPKKTVPFQPYLGPEFSSYQVHQLLLQHKLKFRLIKKREVLLHTVAKLLAAQKVIGWFQGRMEWGPRALGNRSILASAGKEEMKEIINARVKHRELFRPFAPVILREQAGKYFFTDMPMPRSADWMLMVYPFRRNKKKELPAVVHVDGTGRLQTIGRQDNPLYYDLVKEFFKLTGVPSFINTSFNVRGEPIVCSPEHAIHCFLHTDIDYLVIDSFIVSK